MITFGTCLIFFLATRASRLSAASRALRCPRLQRVAIEGLDPLCVPLDHCGQHGHSRRAVLLVGLAELLHPVADLEVLVLQDVGQLVHQGPAHRGCQLLPTDRDPLVLERVVGKGPAGAEVVDGFEQVHVAGEQPERPHQSGELLDLRAVLRGELLLVGRDALLELGRGQETDRDRVHEEESALSLRDLDVRRDAAVPAGWVLPLVGVAQQDEGRRCSHRQHHHDRNQDHPDRDVGGGLSLGVTAGLV